MQIIGVNGFKRSGKGETALAVQRALPDKNVKLVGFADKLKILGARTLGFTDKSDEECIRLMDEAKESWDLMVWRHQQQPDLLLEPYSPNVGRLSPGWFTKVPVTNITGRQYLQNLGTEARKVFGPDFWVDQVLPQPSYIGRSHHPNTGKVEWGVKHLHGDDVDVLVITDLRFENEAQRIKALGGTIWEVLRPGTASDGHASEQKLPSDLIDREIINDGTLEDLEKVVRLMVRGL
jgi:hypothetical protein